MATSALVPDFQVAWSSTIGEDTRFRKILLQAMAGFLVVAGLVPLISVPPLTREQEEKLPEQLTQVILQKKELENPKPVPIAQPKPKPVVAKSKPKPVVVPKEVPKPRQVDLVKEAREKAAVSGILAFKDEHSRPAEPIMNIPMDVGPICDMA